MGWHSDKSSGDQTESEGMSGKCENIVCCIVIHLFIYFCRALDKTPLHYVALHWSFTAAKHRQILYCKMLLWWYSCEKSAVM